MAWVLDNIQVIIVVASIVAYWLNQRRREKAGQEADYDADGVPENRPIRRKIDEKQPDPEEAERARRIQEDIRRKIAERRGHGAPVEHGPRRPTVHEPPPIPAGIPRRYQPGPTEPPTPTAPGPLPEVLRRLLDPNGEIEAQARARAEAADRAARERLQAMEEELREIQERQRLEANRAAALREASTLSQASSASGSGRGARRSLLDDLREPGSLKRAVVFREVLGPPVALR